MGLGDLSKKSWQFVRGILRVGFESWHKGLVGAMEGVAGFREIAQVQPRDIRFGRDETECRRVYLRPSRFL